MFISTVIRKQVIYSLFITLSVVLSVNASVSDKCHKLCFPEKLYTQCTTKIGSLSLDEQALCSKMTADCQSCTEDTTPPIDQSKNQCKDLCNTEQLIECHKKFETLPIEEKGECSKMTANCQSCTEGKKAQINQTQNNCADICNTEKLIQCNKEFETLSIEQKAFCSKMTADCQGCTEETK